MKACLPPVALAAVKNTGNDTTHAERDAALVRRTIGFTQDAASAAGVGVVQSADDALAKIISCTTLDAGDDYQTIPDCIV